MSNKRAPKSKRSSLQRFRSEVKGGEPYTLWTDEDKDEKIIVPHPTGKTLFDIEEMFYHEGTTSRKLISEICGDKAEEVLSVLEDELPEVVDAVVEDMVEHFGLGKLIGSSN